MFGYLTLFRIMKMKAKYWQLQLLHVSIYFFLSFNLYYLPLYVNQYFCKIYNYTASFVRFSTMGIPIFVNSSNYQCSLFKKKDKHIGQEYLKILQNLYLTFVNKRSSCFTQFPNIISPLSLGRQSLWFPPGLIESSLTYSFFKELYPMYFL